MKLKFGSVCAGIGGFDQGFELAGMECAWQIEVTMVVARWIGERTRKALDELRQE